MNVSQLRREESIKRIKEIRDFISHSAQDENAGRLLTYLSELEKEIKGKKYGLVFEEHREKIDETLEKNAPVLTEQEDLYIDNGGQMNFLIEGDNLAALQLLLKTHRGKIDLIYIDPPYNTGNKDFIYDDDYVDKNDTFRHSKWISFMKKRLKLAKKLLSVNGCIFISIDDNESANLKLLCDEIFHENNFEGQIITVCNPGGRDYKQISLVHEYITSYSRTGRLTLNEIPKEIVFKLSDNDGGYELRELRNRNPKFHSGNRPNLFYSFFVNPNSIDEYNCCAISLEKTATYNIEVKPYNSEGKESVWRWGKTKAQSAIVFDSPQSSQIVAKQKRDGGWNIYEKCRKSTTNVKSLWDETEMRTEDGTRLLRSIFGTSPFDHPKSLSLIYRCILIASNPNSTILDFFAGSGTTGHAVLKLNAEDGGTRRFILCTNNENNICRNITYERIKRVIDKEDYAASLKYFKIDFVRISERLYYEYADELLLHIRELVELENGVNFRNNSEIAIVLTDEELDAFMENRSELKACRALYVGHDVLINGRQSAALKRRKIAVNVIPQYYYEES